MLFHVAPRVLQKLLQIDAWVCRHEALHFFFFSSCSYALLGEAAHGLMQADTKGLAFKKRSARSECIANGKAAVKWKGDD